MIFQKKTRYQEDICKSQEVGGTLVGEDRLVVMVGVKQYEIHKTHGSNFVFRPFLELPTGSNDHSCSMKLNFLISRLPNIF